MKHFLKSKPIYAISFTSQVVEGQRLYIRTTTLKAVGKTAKAKALAHLPSDACNLHVAKMGETWGLPS